MARNATRLLRLALKSASSLQDLPRLDDIRANYFQMNNTPVPRPILGESSDLQSPCCVLFEMRPAHLASRRCVPLSLLTFCLGRGGRATLIPGQQAVCALIQLSSKLLTDTLLNRCLSGTRTFDIWPLTCQQTVSCLRTWTSCLDQSRHSIHLELRMPE